MSSSAAIGASRSVEEDPRYRCGSLVYTKAALFTLFAWLLWGDFCFYLMETIWPTVLPLLLKSEGSSNAVLSLVMTTIPNAMNFILNPIISTTSDRYRGKRGRRIPFLLVATPFVSVFLVLLGFSREIGSWIHSLLVEWSPGLPAGSVVIGTICVLIVCFRFFELFINTVFWYLFNDVVPSAFMGRFLGFFRVVGALSGALFNLFLLRYAESHTSWIFFGVAVLYGSAFLLMCLNVKEGTYPPPEQLPKKDRAVALQYIKTFFRECFSHKIFLLVFSFSAIFSMGATINTFAMFMAFSIGLTLEDFGRVTGACLILSMLLMYPVGALVDRFHPIRLIIVGQIGLILVSCGQSIFFFNDFPKITAFWIYAGLMGCVVVANVMNASALLPLYMRLFPHEKFGQFSSANAMCASMGAMIGGVFAGLCLDGVKGFFTTENFFYRTIPAWTFLFAALALILIILVYREWLRLGGDSGYQSPAAGLKKSHESIDV